MITPDGKREITASERFYIWLFFTILSTIGMAAIGVAVLADPLAGYYADQAVLNAQQKRTESLQELQAQLNELLANADNPSVIERAAISQLKCVPLAEVDPAPPLPREWPELTEALRKIDQTPPPPVSESQRFMQTLAGNWYWQTMLMILGSAMVVTALTFFYKPS